MEAVDPKNRKISLIPAELGREEEEDAAALKNYQQQAPSEPEGLGTLGEILKKQLENKEKIR